MREFFRKLDLLGLPGFPEDEYDSLADAATSVLANGGSKDDALNSVVEHLRSTGELCSREHPCALSTMALLARSTRCVESLSAWRPTMGEMPDRFGQAKRLKRSTCQSQLAQSRSCQASLRASGPKMSPIGWQSTLRNLGLKATTSSALCISSRAHSRA